MVAEWDYRGPAIPIADPAHFPICSRCHKPYIEVDNECLPTYDGKTWRKVTRCHPKCNAGNRHDDPSRHGKDNVRRANSKKDRHTAKRSDRTKNKYRLRPYLKRPIIAINGVGGPQSETGQQDYVLLCAQSADGTTSANLFKKNQCLRTKDCLDWLLRSLPSSQDAIFVTFNLAYNVAQILRDVPPQIITSLVADGKFNIRYGEYLLNYIPEQYFRVSRWEWAEIKGVRKLRAIAGTTHTIYYVADFFSSSSLPKALHAFRKELNLSDDDIAEIERVNNLPATFEPMDPAKIDYYKLECRSMAKLIDTLRRVTIEAEQTLRRVTIEAEQQTGVQIWPAEPAGPGRLATSILHSIKFPTAKELPALPPQLRDAMAKLVV
jgi:hypothetical protein